MLRLVPIMKPASPMIPIKMFLKIINAFANPCFVFHLATVSKNAGNKMPSVERASAPSKLMNRSKCGIATAKITANRKSNIEINYFRNRMCPLK